MSKPTLSLRGKKDAELHSYARSVIQAMRQSPHFSGHEEELDEAEAEVQAFAESINHHAILKGQLRGATMKKRQQRKSTESTLTSLAVLVTRVAKGRQEVMRAAHMRPRRPRTPVGMPPAPGDLRARPGNFEGTCLLDWDSVKGAGAYEIEYALRADTQHWTRHGASLASKATVDGLTPGTAYAFRVRALGAAGPSPWSDPAFCRAG